MSSSSSPKVCPYPFSRMEVRAKSFVPCCSSWLTAEFHALEAGSDVWNGPAAQELRRRIYAGDYSLCKRELCGVPITSLEESREPEAQVVARNVAAVHARQTVMPASPSSLAVVADPRCNLACPSCRTGHILQLTENQQDDIEATEDRLERSREDLECITFGDGEVLFSPWMRKILQSLHPERYPRLRSIEIKTNGLLFDERNYELLMPGAQFINRIAVSMDAGTEDVYRKVRGGDWPRLLENLKWMSDLRREKKLKNFQINFTVRLENFESLPQFVEIGKSLAVDAIKIASFEPWGRMAVKDYSGQAIHLPQHPRHHELYEIWNAIRAEPKVWWALPVPEAPRSKISNL